MIIRFTDDVYLAHVEFREGELAVFPRDIAQAFIRMGVAVDARQLPRHAIDQRELETAVA